MKVALILSVVALVAVSQPTFSFPPHPAQVCNLIRQHHDEDMVCCIPPQFGGCQAPPGMFPRGMPLPPGYLPPPDFLHAVCCSDSETCCVNDDSARNVRFSCCDDSEECVMDDGEGTCEDKKIKPETPDVPHLESGGQCPDDGSLAVEVRPGEPWRCTFNELVNGYTCPDDTHCVRDNTGNVNSGVCCRDTTETDKKNVTTIIGCNKYTDCHTCVQNEDDDVNARCGWLTQGSLDNRAPRCVMNCDNFPTKSCVLPSDGRLCPVDVGYDDSNATIVNTGTCSRRCGYIGTGRAAGINNIGNRVPPAVNASEIEETSCCKKYPGDYCCDGWMQLASHCNNGRAPEGPLCGVPVRGTPNALYVPEYEPLGPYAPAPYGAGPTPFGNFPPYGTPFGYGPPSPMLPYGPYPPMGPRPPYFGPMPFGPVPYGPWREGEVVSDDVSDVVKQLMFPPPPAFYPLMPPIQPQRIPSIVDINPSPFVCSCDEHCMDYEDCCEDHDEHCAFEDR